MRGTFVLRNGRMVRKEHAGPPPSAGRALGRGAYVISDTMEPVRHMGTGQVIDSKSKFRADTRASGCVEVGTDPAARREKPRYSPSVAEIVPDVKRAIEELRSR